jgi:GNAT superfamily N-acetyltransferase
MATEIAVPVARTKVRRRRSTARLPLLPPPTLAPPSDGPRLVPARSGDHLAIHRLLVAAFHGPSPAEYQAQADEPGYDPADRLLVKLGEQVAAHLRLRSRLVQLDSVQIPAVRVMDLVTAPEYRGQGFASSLLCAAERRARESGMLLGLTRTRAPSLFARQGWAVCGRHVFSTAGARQVLAQLRATAEGILVADDDEESHVCLPRPAQPAIVLRPLRRIELPAVMRLYEQALAGRCGAPARSEAFWEWLLGRGACDAIYVAAEGPESADLALQLAGIRGCVFVREGRIIELLVQPGRDDVARSLVARVCADASELNQWQVRLDAPPDDLLHGLFDAAGGQVRQAEELGGEVYMAKVFDLAGVLARMGDLFTRRLRAAGLPRPVEMGLEIQGATRPHRTHASEALRLRLVFTSRGMKLAGGPLSRNHLSLRRRDVAALLLGHWNLADLIDAGRVRASSKSAGRLGRALFPKLPWWQPPLDDLLA